MKRKVLFAIGAGLTTMLALGIGTSSVAQANWQTDNTIDYRDTEATAEARVNQLCATTSTYAAHAGWLGSGQVTPNANGEFQLDLLMKYKRCSSAYEPRKYAITGYPSNDLQGVTELSFCDNIGTFGNHMRGTRSSIGIPPFVIHGPWTWTVVRGNSPGPRTAADVRDYTYDCVKYMGADNGHIIRFNSARYGNTPGFYMYNELGSVAMQGPIYRSISGKITNWEERRNTAGVQKITLPSSLCSFYYMVYSDGSYTSRHTHCQTVEFDVVWGSEYSLTPSVSIDTRTVIDGEQPRISGIEGSVQNDSLGSSEPSRSMVSRFVVRKDDRTDAVESRLNAPGERSSVNPDMAAQEYIQAQFNGQEYRQLLNRNAQAFNPGTQRIYNDSESIEAPLFVGDKICYITSVQRPTYSHGQNDWRHSAAACATVGMRPHVQVRSGDILVGGQIITNTTTRQAGGEQRRYGSWAEYGAIAGGAIHERFGSGAVYRMGLADGRANNHFLSFANTPSPGRYGTVADGSDAIARFFSDMEATVSGAHSPDIDMSDFGAGRHVLRPNGNVRLQGNLQVGASVIVLMRPGATAQVVGDVTTPQEYASVGDISQLVIAPAGTDSNFAIHVAPSVSRVDAWLIAPQGRVDTCHAGSSTSVRTAPHAGEGGCATPLQVNGPVAANGLLLGRAGGRDRMDGQDVQSVPAENFTLRPDAYLWISNQVQTGGTRYITTHSLDLPPRF